MSEIEYGGGWHGWETDRVFPFRWMSRQAGVRLPREPLQGNRYLTLLIFSEFTDYSQTISVTAGGRELAVLPLLYQWSFYSIDLRPDAGETPSSGSLEVSLTLSKVFPERYHPGDGRELGVRVGPIDFHDDPVRHESLRFFLDNAQRNNREMREGKTKLTSYPINLGIDIYGKCNINPPCVYCLWDKMKVMEGKYTDAVVDDRTLEGYGPFFKAARNLEQCSFGEPLLHPRFKEILELSRRHGKFMEISTNGQAFTCRTIEALVGKHVYLYVSLDAATRETYARIRNDNWDKIIPNLELLNQERKKEGNFPKIFMVFMPMHVNENDLEAYFQLCRKVEADSVILRPLISLWNPKIERDRGGYHFDYKREYLSREEMEDVVRRCEEYSRRYGVPVANQLNFGTLVPPGSKR